MRNFSPAAINLVAFLSLSSAGTASADTIVDFTYSGELELNFQPTGTIATASGQLVFDQTGTYIQPSEVTIDIAGVPGYTNQGFGPPQYDNWNIDPGGNLLDGLYEASSSDGADDGQTFLLSDGFPGGSGFDFYLDEYDEYSFSGDPTFTQIEPVPEPLSITVFGAGLLALMLVRGTRLRV